MKTARSISRRRWCSLGAAAAIASALTPTGASELPVLGAATSLVVDGSGYEVFELREDAVLRTQQWDLDGNAAKYAMHGYPSRFDVGIRTTAAMAALVIHDVDGPSDFEYAFLHLNSRVDRCNAEPCSGMEIDRPIYSTRNPARDGNEWLWDLPAGRYAIGLITDPPAPAEATLRLDAGGESQGEPVVLQRATSGTLRGGAENSTIGMPSAGAYRGHGARESFGFAYLVWTHAVAVTTETDGQASELCSPIGCSRRFERSDLGGLSLTSHTVRLSGGKVPWMSWRMQRIAPDQRFAAGLLSWPRIALP